MGESGKGKTTLLHLLAGLMPVKTGSIRINDTDLKSLSGSALDSFRGKHIGIVFQQSLFLRSITVIQNLLMAQRLAGATENKELALEVLSDLNISDKVNMLPSELSIGEKQRASIARALVTEPALVLADEPTSALDDKSCERVSVLLENAVTKRGAALIVVTHDKRLKDRFKNAIEL